MVKFCKMAAIAACVLGAASATPATAFSLGDLQGWTLSRIASSAFNFSGERGETPVVGPECDYDVPQVEAACPGPNGYVLFLVDSAAGEIAIAGPDWSEAPVVDLAPAARAEGLAGPIAVYGRTVRWRMDDQGVPRALIVRVVDADGDRARVVVAVEPALSQEFACVVNAFADGVRAYRAAEEEAAVASILLCRD